MANYIAEVAKMLDVNTGEYFKINGLVGTYVLTHDGLHEINSRGDCGTILSKLLSGAYTIVQKPWVPHYDEEFYMVGCEGHILKKYWDNCTAFKTYYKIGNCYQTREDAVTNKDKWMKFYASDEILEV